MPLELLTAPITEPLSLVEAKLHARVTASQTQEDSLINALVAAARDYAQNKTQRQLIAARYQYVLDSFPGPGVTGVSYVPWGHTFGLPGNAIVLPIGPALEIESIKYTDMSGTVKTLTAGTDYVVTGLNSEQPVRITPPFGQVWPPNVLPQIGSVIVTFKAGMCAPVTSVDTAANTITVQGWKTLAVNDVVRLFVRDKASAGDGTLPAPLKALTDYYVQSVVSTGVYTLSASSGGAAIDITNVGGGDIFVGDLPQGMLSWLRLSVTTMYENRTAVLLDQRITQAALPPEFLDGLLDPYRLALY